MSLIPQSTTGHQGRRSEEFPRHETKQMDKHLPRADKIVLLAGMRYREFMLPYLRERAQVIIPLQGLTMGRQLQRLKQLEGPFSKGQFD